MANFQELYKYVLIFLVSVCITHVAGRPKRSTSPTSAASDACAEADASSAVNTNYAEALEDLKTKTQAVINNANATKNFLWNTYQGTYDLNEPFIQEKRFMDLSDISSPVDQKIETLKLQYALVHEHLEYVRVTLEGTKISTESVLTGTKTRLEEYKMSLNRCLCSIRLALVASGYTDQVPTKDTTNVANILHFWSGSMQVEIWTAYIVSNDGLDLSKALKLTYENEIMQS